jgi:NAD(P)-dependent dehydrogenase (short-subunit alcohol dehydrogenase family)
MSLEGKVAIVTGGNSGIGGTCVLALTSEEAGTVMDDASDALPRPVSRTEGFG